MPKVTKFPSGAEVHFFPASRANHHYGKLIFAAIVGNWTIHFLGGSLSVSAGSIYTGVVKFNDTSPAIATTDATEGHAVWEFELLTIVPDS